MGFPYRELIGPAILHDNPGLKIEEFRRVYDGVQYSDNGFDKEDPWDSNTTSNSERKDPLHKLLGLKHSKAYEIFQTPSFDSNGIQIDPPDLWPAIPRKEKRIFDPFSFDENVFQEEEDDPTVALGYEVYIHLGNELGSPELVKLRYNEKLEVGKIFVMHEFSSAPLIYPGEDTRYFVTKVINEEIIESKSKRKKGEIKEYQYVVEAKPITEITEIEFFATEEEVFKKWPQFKPENKYDFTQTNGNFYVIWGNENFSWKQEDGRFYLGDQAYDRMSAGFPQADSKGRMSFGYTDLILTAEAIKHKAWKLLSYRGLDHLNRFLEDFPDSKQRYDQAIWDAHSSLLTKQRGLTNTELMRFRLFPNAYSEDLEEPNL